MALLQKIKEKLGFGGGSSDSDGGETTVTVEHEPDDSGTAESAETNPSATEADASVEETTEPGPDEGASTDATAEGSADEEVDAAVGGDETSPDAEGEGESAEAEVHEDGETEVDKDGETEVDDAGDATAESDADAADTAAAADDGTPVDQIKGIGPAYAERLGEIGIHTVEDLAGADAAAIADGTSVGEGRATTWIDRAAEF